VKKSGYDMAMDDNSYECPNCGATIYPEMTRCPQCGHSIYPENDESVPIEAVATTPAWISFMGTMLIGWIIAVGIALIVHFVMDAFVSPSALGSWGKMILFGAGPFGAVVGAFVSTGLYRKRSILMGGVVGALAVPVLVLLATHWVKVTLSLLFSSWGVLLGFLTILAGVLGGWLSINFSPESDWEEKWRVHGWEDLLYQDLLRKVRFNGSAADRLIEFERKQTPQASRLELIQNAIDRWERDNR
jgi:hypothetical protein